MINGDIFKLSVQTKSKPKCYRNDVDFGLGAYRKCLHKDALSIEIARKTLHKLIKT